VSPEEQDKEEYRVSTVPQSARGGLRQQPSQEADQGFESFPKTSFCYIINFAQVEDEAAESLLQMSQLLNEQEIIQQAPSFLAKDQLSSGIKLILSKKSAKKSDQKKGRDRTPSRVEDNPRKKEHFR
jgi:hypothetical protein